MSKLIRKSGLSVRLSSILLLLVFSAFAISGHAQTVIGPQLLPTGTVTILAGGASSNPASGAKCGTAATPLATDKYGDGCLATQIALVGPRYAVQDSAGNFFISDYTNAMIRRIDATTGIITAVAGGATSTPAVASACGAGVSADIFGNGCTSTLVALSKPEGMAFAPNGDLYFVDGGHDTVRKLTAVGGLIPATGGTIISNVAGFAPTTGSASFGFVVSNSTTAINAATQSYVDGPFGLNFDNNGTLFIADEFKNAIYAINVGSANVTVYGVTVKPGQIWKVVGTTSTAGAGSASAAPVDCPNGTSGTFGCNFIATGYIEGGAAGANPLDSPYGVAFDSKGTLYIANEFVPDVPQVSPAGLISTFAGIQAGGTPDVTKRYTPASTGEMGSTFAITVGPLDVVYFTDAFNGVVWRVDPDTKTMYVVAGAPYPLATPGTPPACTASLDTYGDGCLASQAIFGKTGTKFASATAPGPGIFGVSADKYDNLYVGDSINSAIRKIGNGTDFGVQTTTTVTVHYFKGDSPKANGYVISSGSSIIHVGTISNCTPNADGSQDCPVQLVSTPTVLGPYTGTLTISSTAGTTSSYPLTGTYAPTPVTKTAVTYSVNSSCTGTSIATGTPVTLTATVTSVGTATGTVQFYANNVAIGTPATLNSGVATTTYSFTSTGTYTISATYSGDAYYQTSTGTATGSLVVASAGFTTTIVTSTTTPIVAGQTGLYSFNVVQNVYTGTITFACTNLPAGASCSFSPPSIAAAGCSTTNTVALNIYTTQPKAVGQSAIGISGSGLWRIGAILASLLMALALGLRRRTLRFRHVWMSLALLGVVSGLAACGNRGFTTGTPSGNYTITVTTTGSTGTPATFTVPLNVQ